MKIFASAISDKGPVREKNEDFFCVDKAMGLLAVADGIGGHAAGEVASRMAIEVIRDFIANNAPSGRMQMDDYDDAFAESSNLAAESVRLANHMIFDAASRTPSRRGMGTTLTASLVRGKRMSVVHVGDSRAYLVRAGCIEQITDDHSLVADQVRTGILTAEQAGKSDIKNVLTRCLGTAPDVKVDIGEVPLSDGDTIVLCTDGITSVVDEGEILAEVSRTKAPLKLCRALIRLANEKGSRDNMTVVAAHVCNSMVSYLYHLIHNSFGR